MSATKNERLLNVRETARLLSIGERTLYNLVASGQVPAFKVGGVLRFSRDELFEWLHANRREATR